MFARPPLLSVRTALLLTGALYLLSSSAAMAAPCNEGPSGGPQAVKNFEGGDFIISNNSTRLCSGKYINIGNFVVNNNRTLHLGDEAKVEIYAKSIRVRGNINGVGVGSAGGSGCSNRSRGEGADGDGLGAGKRGGSANSGNHGGGGGGGAGHVGDGGDGGVGRSASSGGSGGKAYGTQISAASGLSLGSGGGGGACGSSGLDRGGAGGGGGAALLLAASDLSIYGDIRMGGANGAGGSTAGGGGGGGSGGSLHLIAQERLQIQQNLSVAGGSGGNGSTARTSNRAGGGGGGASGGSLLIYSAGPCSSTWNVDYGAGSPGSGGSGASNGEGGAPGKYKCENNLKPPTLDFFKATPNPAGEGSVVTLSALVTSPNGHRIDYTFDCGNGEAPVTTTQNSVECMYSDDRENEAPYLATLSYSATNREPFRQANGNVSEPSGSVLFFGPFEAELDVEVNNLPPALFLTLPSEPMPGEDHEFKLEVQDPSPVDQAAGFEVSWSIGDPVIFMESGHNLLEVSTVFERSGTYPIEIRVEDKDGGVAELFDEILIPNPPPTVTLHPPPNPIKRGEMVIFKASASDGSLEDEAAGFTFTFDFGDGNTRSVKGGAMGQSVEIGHVYTASGPYTVQVTATDQNQDTSTPASEAVEVLPGNSPPTVSLLAVPTQLDEGDSTLFSASFSSSEAGVTISRATFYFGDGESHAVNNPSTPLSKEHLYLDSGSFSAWILVEDSQGGQNIASTDLVINNLPPSAQIHSVSEGWEGSGVVLLGIGSDPSPVDEAAGLTFIWDFGDGSPKVSGVNLSELTHTWADSGSYMVSLVVRDKDGGESAPALRQVEIQNVAPTVQLQLPSTAGEGEELSFFAEVSDPSPADTAAGFDFSWNFGDGSPLLKGKDLATVQHVYEQDGEYQLTLSVSDASGGTTTETWTLMVHNLPPEVELGEDLTLARNEEVTLTATVSDPGIHDELEYLWDFGDGIMSDAISPTHWWSKSGDYTVTLTVTDDAGDSGSASMLVHVRNELPVASNVLLSPAQPLPSDELKVTWHYADADGDPEQDSKVRWFVDDDPRHRLEGMRTIPASRTLRGEVWHAEITPHDGYGYGEAVKSNPVTIGNHPPMAYNIQLIPERPRRGDTLELRYDFVDPDDDVEDGSQIEWYRDGTLEPEYSNQKTITPLLTRGEQWMAVLRASDGMSLGQRQSSPAAEVRNTPPIISPIPPIVLPATARHTEVSWEVVASDPDDDPLQYRCVHDGRVFGTNPIVRVLLASGTYRVECAVSDGIDVSSILVNVLVGNEGLALEAGDDRVVNPGRVRLDAFAASNMELPITYQWTVLSAVEPVEIADPTEASTHFFATKAGVYELEVTASSGEYVLVDHLRIEVRNLPPNADPGNTPKTAQVGEMVELDGSQSSDPNGDSLTYRWQRVRGPAIEIEGDKDSPQFRFIAHDPGELVLRLNVSDGFHESFGEHRVLILTSGNETTPPQARAGSDVVALLGETVFLDGSASFDLDGDPLSYEWTQTSGHFIQLFDADQAVANFVALSEGHMDFQLSVSDGLYDSTDSVGVQVLDSGSNHRPVAKIAGKRFELRLGDELLLDGAGSSDPDRDPLTFSWKVQSGPWLNIESPNEERTVVVPVNEGRTVVELRVNDGMIDSFPAEVEIISTKTGPVEAPIAKAIGPKFAYLGETLELDASKSSDPAGLELTYLWTVEEGGAKLDANDLPKVSFTATRKGRHVFKLIVSNEYRSSEPVLLEVKVEGVPELVGGCACNTSSPSHWGSFFLLGLLVLGMKRKRRAEDVI